MSPYDQDLAYVHDTGFGGHAAGAAPALLSMFREAGIESGLVVDLGCGSGILAKELATAGYSVVGVDISPAMIELARKKVPSGRFVTASFNDFEIPGCRAVTALGEVFNYLFDENVGCESLRSLFARIFAALAPGGLLVFDVIGRFKARPPLWTAGDDWACLVKYEYDDLRDRLTRDIITFRRRGELYRRSDERHVQQLYRPAEIRELLREAGFRARTVRKFGEHRLLPGRTGFVAHKPFPSKSKPASRKGVHVEHET